MCIRDSLLVTTDASNNATLANSATNGSSIIMTPDGNCTIVVKNNQTVTFVDITQNVVMSRFYYNLVSFYVPVQVGDLHMNTANGGVNVYNTNLSAFSTQPYSIRMYDSGDLYVNSFNNNPIKLMHNWSDRLTIGNSVVSAVPLTLSLIHI